MGCQRGRVAYVYNVQLPRTCVGYVGCGDPREVAKGVKLRGSWQEAGGSCHAHVSIGGRGGGGNWGEGCSVCGFKVQG